MDLILNEDQILLKDSAAKFVEQNAGSDLARKVRQSHLPFDPNVWQEMADAGWLAILVPEQHDGLGLGMTELSLILEETGKSIMPGPIAAVSAVAKTLAVSPHATEFQSLIESIVTGETIVIPAFQEHPFVLDPEGPESLAEIDGEGWRITGEKKFIPEAGAATGFLVNAHGPDGLLLVYVPNGTEGVQLDLTTSVDGGDTGSLKLDQVFVAPTQIIAGPNQALQICQHINDLIAIGLSAELLGVMEKALDMSVDYIKIRTQFDQPIGKFQALQHRAVNDYVDIELTRSLLYQVCAMADRNEDISAMAAALKAKASRAALTVTKSAVQFHGAIGVSDEHDIGLYLKRAIALSTYYGNEMSQRKRFTDLQDSEKTSHAD